MVELHLHGGRAVVAGVEAALAAIPGLRKAEPGEFTRRALQNGRLDLTQAQGLADLLEAETEEQRRAALLTSEGGLAVLVRDWLDRLSTIGAMIEATIDFSDEDDVGPTDPLAIDALITGLAGEITAMVSRPTVERAREGLRVVLAGPPNAGKSSLFNALIGRDAAIVSSVAGTTRDLIEATVRRHGKIFTLSDTAGQRDHPVDPIEAAGIDRAVAATQGADVVLWLDDRAPTAGNALWIYPRADLPGRSPSPPGSVAVSTLEPGAVESVWRALERRAAEISPLDLALLHRGQRAAAQECANLLAGDGRSQDWLVRAEAIRRGSRALASILGVDATEAMLDALFARFCIGK